jgi:hypothetical protein
MFAETGTCCSYARLLGMLHHWVLFTGLENKIKVEEEKTPLPKRLSSVSHKYCLP